MCRQLGVQRLASRVLEALLLAIAGGLLAFGFIGLVLDALGNSPSAVTVTGLLFMIWPGLLNLLAEPFGWQPVDREALLHIAFGVGALTGGFDGAGAIHRWRGWGPIAFVLDVTWGLAGSTNAVLLHLVNLGWGRRAGGENARRQGGHLYARGFAPGRGFAFTQGSVMSNTGDACPSGLFAHETVHIWQSRIAGPFFWFSYLGWQVLATPPAIVFALVARRPVGQVVQWWAYFNNPWEVMAYERANPSVRTRRFWADGEPVGPWACWPMRNVWLIGGLGFLGLLAGFLAVVAAGASS
jgi:hypothetical protein